MVTPFIIGRFITLFIKTNDFFKRGLIDSYLSGGELNTALIIRLFFQFFIIVNIGLAVFNLIPIPPLALRDTAHDGAET